MTKVTQKWQKRHKSDTKAAQKRQKWRTHTKCDTKATQKRHKSNTKATQKRHKSDTKATQKRHKSDTHKSDTKPTQKRHKTDTKATQNRHKSDTKPTQKWQLLHCNWHLKCHFYLELHWKSCSFKIEVALLVSLLCHFGVIVEFDFLKRNISIYLLRYCLGLYT